MFYLLPCAALAAVLAAAGAAGWAAASIGLVGGLLLSSVEAGTEISPDLSQSRQYLSLLRWRVGRWQSLPPVVGVTLKYYSTLEKGDTASTTSWGVWSNPRNRHEELIVMLSLQQRTNGFILAHFSPDDVNDAIDFAHDTAERFRVPVNQYLPAHLYQPLPPASGGKQNK
ncbi:hypothetical protein A8B98_13230 [Hymenobacter sp. UV11]|nr:hypothetical protein A8B98_13230 [Hymenobacter sp. UV11]